MKNRKLHSQIIQKYYDDFDTNVLSCKTPKALLHLSAKLYREMDRANQEYGFWDERKGIDADAVYYVAEHAVKVCPTLVDSALEMELDQQSSFIQCDSDHGDEHTSAAMQFSALLQKYMNNCNKIRFHVLEPHPDDALGSACGILYNRNVLTVLHTLTISNDERDKVVLDPKGRRQYTELRKEPNIIRHNQYMLPDLHYNLRIISENTTYLEKCEYYKSIYPSIFELVNSVEQIVMSAQSENAYIALPMGLEHPMHILVVQIGLECIERHGFPWDKVLIYVDHPYDYDLIGTDRMLHVREFLEQKIRKDLLRCDDLGAPQSQLDPVIRTLYGEGHLGEFNGTLSKTSCSYFITKSTYDELQDHFFHLQYNRVLFITSQAWPYYKTGGLGEVAYSYCKALQSSVDDIRVLLPGYPDKKEVKDDLLGNQSVQFEYKGIEGKYVCNIEQRKYNGLIFYFLNMEDPQGNRIAFTEPEKNGKEFSLFCDALLQRGLNSLEEFVPTVCHCNDWQTALIPFLKKTKYRHYRRDMRVVYTIHFYGYKGIYPKKDILSLLGMDKHSCKICIYCSECGGEFSASHGCVLSKIDLLNESAKAEIVQTPPSLMSFMRAGIEFADAVTTVSKGYAEEIQGYPDFKGIKVSGIRNGIPSRSGRFILEDKKACKSALQEKLGLQVRDDVPLLCMVSRLAIEKGINTVNTILPYILKEKVQFVIVGDDSDRERPVYADFFRKTATVYSNCFAYREYDKELEFEVYSAADILLMPSLSEACGTTQMLAMQYGTVPIVSMLRSFRDTVMDFKDIEIRANAEHWGKGVGFYAYVDDCWVLLEVLKKAVDVYINEPDQWAMTRKYCFDTDFSWRNGPIYDYLKLYNELWK